MSTNHQARCAWIQQNDAEQHDHTPFLCGAATAQMILYGRADAKFSGNQLIDSEAQLRSDQDRIWRSIKRTSKTMSLPRGVHYDGRPQQEQIRDTPSHVWTTFPDALAETISGGVDIASGHIPGVATRVRKVNDSTELEPVIVDSLDRGVAAAVLVDGSHWVVVHRYVVNDNGTIAIYHRDGMHPKLSADSWSESDFTDEVLDAEGIYSGKYVAVTASSRVPLVSPAGSHRALQRAASRTRPAKKRPAKKRLAKKRSTRSEIVGSFDQPFPDTLGPQLAAELAHDIEWALAFSGALQRFVLKVSGTRPGADYYLVDYNGIAAAASALTGMDVNGGQRGGSIIVDAYTLKPRIVAGIDQAGQRMPLLIGPSDVPAVLERLGYHVGTPRARSSGGRPTVRVAEQLIWTRCDQSNSPFLPFYQVYQTDPRTHTEKKLYLRVDGRLFKKLTSGLSGI